LRQVKRHFNHFIFQTVLTYHLSSILFRNSKQLWPSDDKRHFPGTAVGCA